MKKTGKSARKSIIVIKNTDYAFGPFRHLFNKQTIYANDRCSICEVNSHS